MQSDFNQYALSLSRTAASITPYLLLYGPCTCPPTLRKPHHLSLSHLNHHTVHPKISASKTPISPETFHTPTQTFEQPFLPAPHPSSAHLHENHPPSGATQRAPSVDFPQPKAQMAHSPRFLLYSKRATKPTVANSPVNQLAG